LIVLVLACRRDRATQTSPGAAGLRISDEELVAFTRWQRDLADLFRQHRAELEAVSGTDVPKVTELVARQAPRMQAHLDRVPLKGRKAELVTEAVGGLFHVENTPTGYDLVVARDEVRLRAARRRFGDQAIDDILARESLILAQLPRP
jgi:hypothetical protein